MRAPTISIATETGRVAVRGWAMSRAWGVCVSRDNLWNVTHLPGGRSPVRNVPLFEAERVALLLAAVYDERGALTPEAREACAKALEEDPKRWKP